MRSVPGMNVAENVELKPPVRADLFNAASQFLASGVLYSPPRRHTVQYPVRRPVRDQHVYIIRDKLPLFRHFGPAFQIERPIIKPRLPRRAVKPQALDLDGGILQINDPHIKQRLGRFPVLLEQPVMISRNKDLVRMGQPGEPFVKQLDLVQRNGDSRVVGMDKNVPVRNRDLLVAVVSVGQTDYPRHKISSQGGLFDLATVSRDHPFASAIAAISLLQYAREPKCRGYCNG